MKTCEICHFCLAFDSLDTLLITPYDYEIDGFLIAKVDDRQYIHKSCLEKASQAAQAS